MRAGRIQTQTETPLRRASNLQQDEAPSSDESDSGIPSESPHPKRAVKQKNNFARFALAKSRANKPRGKMNTQPNEAPAPEPDNSPPSPELGDEPLLSEPDSTEPAYEPKVTRQATLRSKKGIKADKRPMRENFPRKAKTRQKTKSPLGPKVINFKIEDHRRIDGDPDLMEFELLVKYGNLGTPVWKEEYDMHATSASRVSKYWKTVKGGRRRACNDLWQIYRIVTDRLTGSEKKFQVEWVGSTAKSWEPLGYVKTNAPKILKQYLEGEEAVKVAAERDAEAANAAA